MERWTSNRVNPKPKYLDEKVDHLWQTLRCGWAGTANLGKHSKVGAKANPRFVHSVTTPLKRSPVSQRVNWIVRPGEITCGFSALSTDLELPIFCITEKTAMSVYCEHRRQQCTVMHKFETSICVQFRVSYRWV